MEAEANRSDEEIGMSLPNLDLLTAFKKIYLQAKFHITSLKNNQIMAILNV